MRKFCLDKQCRRRGRLLSASQFPRCKGRVDNLNTYCKECSVRRVREYRERVRAKKQAHQIALGIDRKPMIRAPYFDAFTKVYEAICKGSRTREEIHEATGVDYDRIGEAICELVWDCKVVKIKQRQLVLVEDELAA